MQTGCGPAWKRVWCFADNVLFNVPLIGWRITMTTINRCSVVRCQLRWRKTKLVNWGQWTNKIHNGREISQTTNTTLLLFWNYYNFKYRKVGSDQKDRRAGWIGDNQSFVQGPVRKTFAAQRDTLLINMFCAQHLGKCYMVCSWIWTPWYHLISSTSFSSYHLTAIGYPFWLLGLLTHIKLLVFWHIQNCWSSDSHKTKVKNHSPLPPVTSHRLPRPQMPPQQFRFSDADSITVFLLNFEMNQGWLKGIQNHSI